MQSGPDRIEKLLALLLLGQLGAEPLYKKALQLNLAGFTHIEIADLLQTSPQVIRQSLYAVRQAKPRKVVIRRKR